MTTLDKYSLNPEFVKFVEQARACSLSRYYSELYDAFYEYTSDMCDDLAEYILPQDLYDAKKRHFIHLEKVKEAFEEFISTLETIEKNY